MQLSKLEIKGFKSFGDKVVINFDEGITGVVGPNGCGKSNIVDAIRWVLGEQKTKALRSEKMENVIFNGTRNRKPQQMAEVSVTLNNTKNILPTEYAQVTITRRYYRTGESEYLLNGVTCRLKDITNLFLDTGIGSDSYAIIELKMVDDILNDRDNSRRGLFEEAAGISKFKIRKKETFRKLEDTDKDLERVEDLLFEINKNLKTLEKQAKQAERYFEIKEKYKQASIELAQASISKFAESLDRLQKQADAARDEKSVLSALLAEKEAALESQKAGFLNQEKLLASRQRTLNEFVNKIRQYESDKKIKNERLLFLTERGKNIRQLLADDKHNAELVAAQLESLELQQQSVVRQVAEVELHLQEKLEAYESQKLACKDLEAETGAANQQYRQKQDEVYKLRKSLEIAQIQLSSLKQELEKTTSDTQHQAQNLTEFEEKLADIADELAHKNDLLKQMQDADMQTHALLDENLQETEALKTQLAQQSRLADARQNEYNLLKSLVDNLEGFPEAIKFLKKNKGWHNEAPLLSDILTCDEKYRVAIENYLEPLMNYYVVENEIQAIQAIHLLSNAQKGKANFFLLDRFNNFTPLPPQAFEQAVHAISIVEYDAKYSKLVESLLNGVYIAQGEEMPDNDASIFIKLNGGVIKRRYSLTGGSVGIFEGKRIGRAKNLEKLQAEIKALQEQMKATNQALTNKQFEHQALKQSIKKNEIDSLQKQINLLQQEYVAVRSKKEQLALMLSNIHLKQEDIIDKIAQLEEEISINKPASDLEQFELMALEDKINHLGNELKLQNELLAQKSTAYNEQNIFFHQQQNRLNTQAREIEYKQKEQETVAKRLARNTQDLVQIDEDLATLQNSAEVNDDELQAFYKERDAIEQGVNEVERDYYATRNLIDGLEKETREVMRRRELNDGLLSEFQNKVNEAKLELSSIKSRLSVEFGVELTDELMDGYDGGLYSEAELKQRVQDIKQQLEKIGPINPMAMEAYNEIKERHDFIAAQKKDLSEAKQSLMQTISEIDGVARTTFMETFGHVRSHFINVFRSLFTDEDTCDLVLSDPQNPLEATIDIIARPKGKRPLTINQLSGGEKTLTAISLLFAIYLIKPAPFCIFDEVDAPLDDANIDKFNNIIRKFSSDSQFIIVTHNKRTMACTDVIYGITMIEQGVSRVIPVDLRELV